MSTEIPTDVATLVARLDTEQKIAQLHCLSIYDLMDYTLPPTPDGIAAPCGPSSPSPPSACC
ncbi:hypothetical protein [Streptomyces reticuliscabiei]|uniref:hypothetical protein n=1 Tax=Streptomyces reticuliscabiei TaxID=146821 RepID=UPI000A39C38B|nr:hypothetical protein [Streptomyces reticuliscabiei]